MFKICKYEGFQVVSGHITDVTSDKLFLNMLTMAAICRHSNEWGDTSPPIPFSTCSINRHILLTKIYVLLFFSRSQTRFDIALPLHTTTYGKASFETLPFVAIVESIGIAVLKHGNVPSGKLMSSIIQAWPVLLFIVLAACIAGIIIWFVVRSLICLFIDNQRNGLEIEIN